MHRNRGIAIKARLVSLLMILFVLCMPGIGQTDKIPCYNKGIDLAEQGKYDEAIEYFNSAIETDPQDAKVWYNKGVVLTLQGKYDEAIQAYDKSSKSIHKMQTPGTTKAWFSILRASTISHSRLLIWP